MYTHTHIYFIYIHLPAPLAYERTIWLYFIALSKHRIWNELFVRKMAALCLGVRVRREVILDRRLLRPRKYDGENEQQSSKEREGTSIHTRTHIYMHTDRLYMSPVELKKKSLHFLSHSLFIEITYHDCSVICFRWLAEPVSLSSI